MTHSIRFKMTAILISIVAGIIAFLLLANTLFASRYYVFCEKNNLEDSYKKVKTYLKQYKEDQDSEQFQESMDKLSENSNIKIMIAETTGYPMDHNIIYDNMIDHNREYYDIMSSLMEIRGIDQFMKGMEEDEEARKKEGLDSDFYEWLDMVPGLDSEDQASLKKKQYLVKISNDNPSDRKGIYLFGFADDDYTVGMRVPMEGIQENVKISSRFILYIGAIGLVIGSLIMFIYSASFTRPIKKMAAVANRMANLDFEARVTDKSDDELGELGESMNQMSEKLESSVTELKSANLALQKDIRKKEEIDEMRKEFISHVSHELKTPIALIQGYAEGLTEDVTEDAASRQFYCEVISDEAEKMNRMVKRLLSLNQLESGTNQLDLVRFDLNELIYNKIQSSRILFEQKKAKVIFEPERAMYVWADELMIEDAFANYLSNAIHYVREGGQIRIWYEERGSDLRVHVYNEGNPIPDEELEKLWIKFYKVDKARTREYGGNGIGLSIVAAVMNAHGKDYGVQNLDEGVDFYFDLDMELPSL